MNTINIKLKDVAPFQLSATTIELLSNTGYWVVKRNGQPFAYFQEKEVQGWWWDTING